MSIPVRLLLSMMVLAGLCLGWSSQAMGQGVSPRKLADYQRVVVAEDALPVTLHAAQELAHYTGRILGREMPLVKAGQDYQLEDGLSFFVGPAMADKAIGSAQSPWLREEWMIRTIPQGTVLAGDDAPGRATSGSVASGSQLAVYTLLDDHLGVKWFWPGETGEHVPSNPAAVVPVLDVRKQPDFIIRDISLGYTRYQTDEFRQDSALWYKRSRLGWVPAAIFGHSWYYAFDLRTPQAENKYYQTNPEWFALVNGKRRGPQMCTTHPQVIERMVEYVLADTKRAITNISPSDGGGFCQCDEETKSAEHKRLGIPSCTSLDVRGLLSYDNVTPQISDRIFTYANEIARRVREKQPDKGVGMFAYTFYNKPPVNIKKLEPNLYLSFVFQAQSHLDPLAYDQWLENIAGWQKLDAKMVVREGWGNHYLLDLPFEHSRQIHRSLNKAAQLGFIAAYGEGSKSFATQSTNVWAITRTMWNPNISYDEMMKDYYIHAYGPAADAMQAYFETYHNHLQNNWPKRRKVMDTLGVAYVNIVNSWGILFPPAVVEEAEAHLKRAEQLAAGQEEYAKRIGLHRVGQDYTRVMLELLEGYRQLAEYGADLEFFKAGVVEKRTDPKARQALLERLYELGEKREDILLANRNIPGPDEGMYAFTNDSKIRQWHTTVKAMLGIQKETRLTRPLLQETKAPAKAAKKPEAASKVVNAAPQQPASTEAATTAPMTGAVEDLWKLPADAPQRKGAPVLIFGENYGRSETRTIRREILTPLKMHIRLDDSLVSAEQWGDHALVIVTGQTDGLSDKAQQKAVLEYLNGGGRLLLLGTAMRSFKDADKEFLEQIGFTGYRVIRDGQVKFNETLPAGEKVDRDALRNAFAAAYGVSRISGNAQALMTVDNAPVIFISQVGQGRCIVIGREMFRLRLQEKNESKALGGDALRNWIEALILEATPAKK